MTRISGVYAIFGHNSHVYIGQSTDIHNRWRQHVEALDRNEHEIVTMQRHWNKDSRQFTFKIVETCCPLQSILLDRERRVMVAHFTRDYRPYNRALPFEVRLQQRHRDTQFRMAFASGADASVVEAEIKGKFFLVPHGPLKGREARIHRFTPDSNLCQVFVKPEDHKLVFNYADIKDLLYVGRKIPNPVRTASRRLKEMQ